jgi:hypothetical protein
VVTRKQKNSWRQLASRSHQPAQLRAPAVLANSIAIHIAIGEILSSYGGRRNRFSPVSLVFSTAVLPAGGQAALTEKHHQRR